MNTTTTPAAAMLAAITRALGLEDRTIVFHVLDDVIASGAVMDRDDLTDSSDAFLDLAADNDSAPVIDVAEVVTYMIGNGEADSATAADIRTLEKFRDSDPRTFRDVLGWHADVLAALDCLSVPNPYYFDD